MKNAHAFDSLDRIDMAKIDRRARQLRAEAVQNWIKSFKIVLSGYGFGANGRPAQV